MTFPMTPATPAWIKQMSSRRWHAISGDHPDLGLSPTAPGTRYLIDTDPARDPELESSAHGQGAIASDFGARTQVTLAWRGGI
jgi:hypothetical protein